MCDECGYGDGVVEIMGIRETFVPDIVDGAPDELHDCMFGSVEEGIVGEVDIVLCLGTRRRAWHCLQ